jgi:hypothetical protein
MTAAEREAQAEIVWGATDLPLACEIGAKASRRLALTYAVTRYAFSMSICSVHGVDLEPWTAPHLALSRLPREHVEFCHAIVAAYSVVEDLGLSLRASPQNPSRIGNKWNPVVRSNLEGRLDRAGVDLSETLLWTVRGTKRKLEKQRPLPDGFKTPWAASVVRDTEIPVVDAIAYAEWLRSAVASHATKELTAVLSLYDVINVQHLARRLLLESLGFWRWHERCSAGKQVCRGLHAGG